MKQNRAGKGNKQGKKKNGGKAAGQRKRGGARQNVMNILEGYSTHVQLGEPTRDYTRMQSNPVTGPLVGATDFPANMTGKQRCWAKGAFTLPPSGFGYIAVDPHWGSLSGVGINSVYTVQPAYAGTTAQLDGAGGAAGGAAFGTNSLYDASMIGPNENQAQYRPTAAQLRLRYNGTVFNKGGTVIGVQDPKHLSLQGNSFSDFEAYEDSVKFNDEQISKWMKLNWRQLDTDDTQFRRNLPVYTPAGTDPSFYMGFVIQVPATTPSSFEWEFWVCAEFDGINVRNKTLTVFDPVGWGAIHTASVHNKELRRAHQYNDDQAESVGVTATARAAGSTTHVTHISKSTSKGKGNGDAQAAVGGTVGTGVAAAALVGGLLSFLL